MKQLLKPVKKAAVSTEPEWKKVGKQLKPRIAPLALQPSSKVIYQVEKCTLEFSQWCQTIMRNTDSYWILRYNQIIHSVVKLCVCFKFFMKLILLLVIYSGICYEENVC